MKKGFAVLCALLMLFALSAQAEGLTTIEAGKLIISTSPDFPPFEYTDDNDAIIGIEPEIMALICDKIGLELEIMPMDFDSALLAAQQGKSDAVVSGVTVREDRKLVYDFYRLLHQHRAGHRGQVHGRMIIVTDTGEGGDDRPFPAPGR